MEFKNIHLTTIDSTNDYGKKHINEFVQENLTIISADEQTKGKGRFEKSWHSPKDKNIYASFCFTIKKKTQISCLAHLMTLSLCHVLREKNLEPKIKWPNDVYLSNKKVSGVLCEVIFTQDLIQVILGIGVNVNMDQEELNKIDLPATSLQKQLEQSLDREALLKDLQYSFLKNLTIFKNEGFFPFHNEFDSLLLYKGQKVSVNTNGNLQNGILHSTSVDGALNLCLEDKSIISVTSGTLRSIK